MSDFYCFGDHSDGNACDLDNKIVLNKLKDMYEISDLEEIAKKIKIEIKTNDAFNKHTKLFGLDNKEYIEILVKLFPWIWNKNLITYVKNNVIC